MKNTFNRNIHELNSAKPSQFDELFSHYTIVKKSLNISQCALKVKFSWAEILASISKVQKELQEERWMDGWE